MRRRLGRGTPLGRAMLLAGVVTALWAAAAAPARATYGARVTADEPQYLLTALSLAEDRDLDIADELAQERWRDFHQAPLPEQTKPLAGGQRLSPHDPLLPLILAVPMAAGGWLGAKLAMAAMGGFLAAALVWVAVRRFGVTPRLAAAVVLGFSLASPLAAYGVQVYPELPAALAVTVGGAAATGALGRRAVVVALAAATALPWLGSKYVPVAAVLAAVLVGRLLTTGRRRRAAALAVVAGAGAAALVYLAVHQRVYSGWTVYAAGDHFVGGEFTVAGSSPDVAGRSVRLVGLLTDRSFGLAAWAPLWLLAVPAVAGLARRRPPGWAAWTSLLGAGWLTATFVAFTMHGWWWPGRQVVVVLPAAVLAVAWWAAQVSRPARRWLLPLAGFGVVAWAWVVAEVLTRRRRLVIDFDSTANPLYRVWRWFLPDYRDLSAAAWVRHGLWVAVIAALAVYGWRSVAHPPERSPHDAAANQPPASPGPDRQPALARGGLR